MKISDATLLRVDQFSTKGFAWQHPAPSSQKSYRNHIKQFEEYLHTIDKTACNVTEEDIEKYVVYMQADFSPNTIATRIGAVKSYFDWLRRNGEIIYTPKIKSLYHVPVQRVDVTEEEIAELLEQIPLTKMRHIRDAAMVTLMAYRGFSTQEVVDTNVADLDFKNGLIRHRKNWHPMGKASEYVLKYSQSKWDLGLNQKEDDPFFLNKHGRRISSRSLRRHFNTYLEAANLKGRFSTRDLSISKNKNKPRTPQLVTG